MINQAGEIGFDDVPTSTPTETDMCFRSTAHQKSLKSRDESLRAINSLRRGFFSLPEVEISPNN
jgi:hypothetical protein